jgi:serine/threonine protein kinase
MMDWISLLGSCTDLRISNFFEYKNSDDGTILGTGRYATIRPAKKRQGQMGVKDNLLSELSNVPSSGDVSLMSKGLLRPGIMKKKPSFSSLSMVSLPTSGDCALKIINKNLFWERVSRKEERVDAIVRETAVQATLTSFYGHLPLFLKLNTIFETCDQFIMELEFVDSDLFRHVTTSGHLPEIEVAYIVRDLLVAIVALKRLGIAHRDVKPANIFMIRTSNDNNDSRVKLGDFGMAAFVGTDDKLYGRCGTPGYVAPEILSVGVNHGYENKVDLFSLGVTMYILLCGYEPFYGETDEELISANKEAKVDFPDCDWKHGQCYFIKLMTCIVNQLPTSMLVSIEGRDLVEKLLEPDPKRRIEAADALKHPWITRRTTRPAWMESVILM